MFWVMGRREVCGALTLEGVPCQNGPGCRVAHPPVPLATSLEAAGVLEAGPGADPLGVELGDGGPPRFVDPRDPSVAVEDLDDVSLAFAAGRFGVVPAAGPGWRERMVAELRAKVAAMAPLDWRPVTVPWRGYWDRDSAQGTMVFALDPGLVGDGDDPTKVFRSAFQARVLAWAVDHPDGALNQLMFNWGDCLDCAPAEGEGAFGVFYVPVDDPAAAEVPTGSMVVLDEVDYDETILTFDDEDVLAEVVDGVPGPVAGVGGPGDARVLPEGPGFGSRYLTGGAGTPRRPSRSGCPGRGRRQRCGAPGGPFARRAPRRLTRNRPGSSRFAWHSGGREGSSGGGGDRGGDGHDPLPSRPCRSAARAPPRTWLVAAEGQAPAR